MVAGTNFVSAVLVRYTRAMKAAISFILAVAVVSGLKATPQKVDLTGSWVLVKTEDKISAPGFGAAPPVPGGGTAPGNYPPNRTGSAAVPVPELGTPDQEGLQLRIVQREGEVRIERRWEVLGQTRSLSQVFPLDGKDHENEMPGGGAMTTRSRWNGSTLVHEGNQQISLGTRKTDMRIREEYSISRDGRTLLLKTRRATPYGQSESRQTFQKSQN
jgi:hypothetical protein